MVFIEINLFELNGENGFAINGIDNNDNSGRSVSSAGDINGDGIGDLIIGAPYADISSNYNNEGQAYVVFGSDEGFDASFDLADLNGINGFVINGIDNNDNSGYSVSSAGDINGDGIDDLIIGAPNADISSNYSNEGEAYVIFGSSGGFDPTLDLATFDGSGLLITGIDNDDNLGRSVSSAGDINGDGADDLIIGAPYADANNNFDGGQSYVVFGIVPLELIGTEDDDILTGARGDDFIDGLGDDDILQGFGGNDQILGGSGDDLIAAGTGNDTVNGNDGKDDILGGEGNDLLDGGPGADRILGESGDDIIDGGPGADRILGGSGDDIIDGGPGADRILGESGDDIIDGGPGADIIDAGEGRDSVFGGIGRDRIFGGTGDDNLSGGASIDVLTGGFGNDSLHGNAGNDRLIGIDPSDTSVDLGFGAGEIDTLTGGNGVDTFVLGDENNLYYDDGETLSRGESDFAVITDFDSSQDFIQLQGSADLYKLDFFTSELGTIDADLIFDPGITARGEVIATLQDVSFDLALTDSAFIFV